MAGRRQTWDEWVSFVGLSNTAPAATSAVAPGVELQAEDACGSCGRSIEASEDGLVVCGLLVHRGCAVCATCGSSDGALEVFDSRFYCRNHEVKACAGCATAVVPDGEQSVTLFGRTWHSDCMLCWNCDQLLIDPDVQIFDADGQLLCAACSRTALRSAKRQIPTPDEEEEEDGHGHEAEDDEDGDESEESEEAEEEEEEEEAVI